MTAPESTTELTELVHVFDHELRTPLTALSGHLELLRERADDLPVELLGSLAVMARAVERMQATLDGVASLERTAVELQTVG